MKPFELKLGDCLEVLRGMPDNSVDSIVTDPPYGLGKEPDALKMLTDWIETGHHDVKGRGFMGKEWDAFVPQPRVWHECLRVLKPGGHLLAFAGTRTQDLMTLGLRLAGFEIRDLIFWCYGSGFPKSLDVSKQLDKLAGAEREVVEQRRVKGGGMEHVNRTNAAKHDYRPDGYQKGENVLDITAPATHAARQWQGWGTALKPALEPITLARKPLEGTVAANVLKWHTGALNIDGCRVAVPASDKKNYDANMACHERYADGRDKLGGYEGGWNADPAAVKNTGARWPANLIHDGSDEVVGLFPDTGKSTGGRTVKRSGGGNVGSGKASEAEWSNDDPGYGDSGSAARFFYAAKCSKKDRGDGNGHPTVKPTDLMRYLCRLVTPPGGVILDPYMGSGSTGKAAVAEDFKFLGIEREAEYFKIAEARITAAWDTFIDNYL
jgi:DNA modification methylase